MSRGSKTVWTFVITSVALFMVTLDNLVVTNALPVIRRDLDASLEDLEWTVNAYTLSFAVLLLTGAALGDRFGRRLMFSVGLAIFTVASAGAALAPNIEVLVIARAVQGLGGGGSAASADLPSRSGRASAARSWRACRGSGSSGSTFRSVSC